MNQFILSLVCINYCEMHALIFSLSLPGALNHLSWGQFLDREVELRCPSPNFLARICSAKVGRTLSWTNGDIWWSYLYECRWTKIVREIDPWLHLAHRSYDACTKWSYPTIKMFEKKIRNEGKLCADNP